MPCSVNDSDSILSVTRAYYQYITLNHHLTNEDEIVLHNARCLTRLCNSSSDVDSESYINKLYRLFLYVSKFLRNWYLPSIGGDLDSYAARIMFIIKTGIEYEKKADYVRMCDSLRIQQSLPAPMLRYFYLPAEGCEMATIGIGEDGEYADGFIRPVKEQIRVPFDAVDKDRVKVLFDKQVHYKPINPSPDGKEITIFRKFYIPHKTLYKFYDDNTQTNSYPYDIYFCVIAYDAYGSLLTDNIGYVQTWSRFYFKEK